MKFIVIVCFVSKFIVSHNIIIIKCDTVMFDKALLSY